MKNYKKLWRNEQWYEFSEKVKKRDSYKCLSCDRSSSEVVLQIHHDIYVQGKYPWEYLLSDCRTLCKGGHARHHGLIEPNSGWTLISIDDLGGLYGNCERVNCGHEIRFEYLTYHPSWGYKKVSSTCIEHLTQSDKLLSKSVIKYYTNISKFVSESSWIHSTTKNGKKYIFASYKHHQIRIYGESNNYSFQIVLKEVGFRKYDYLDFVPTKGKSLEETKELAYIALKGTLSESETEKLTLRNIYRSIK